MLLLVTFLFSLQHRSAFALTCCQSSFRPRFLQSLAAKLRLVPASRIAAPLLEQLLVFAEAPRRECDARFRRGQIAVDDETLVVLQRFRGASFAGLGGKIGNNASICESS